MFKLDDVVRALENGEELPERLGDHELKGSWSPIGAVLL